MAAPAAQDPEAPRGCLGATGKMDVPGRTATPDATDDRVLVATLAATGALDPADLAGPKESLAAKGGRDAAAPRVAPVAGDPWDPRESRAALDPRDARDPRDAPGNLASPARSTTFLSAN